MELYNEALDTIATNIKPFYVRGMVDHYRAVNAETGEKLRIERGDIRKCWKDTRYINVEALRTHS